MADTRDGAVTAANGSTLLRSYRHQKSEAIILQRLSSVGVADPPDQSIDIGVERGFTLGCPVWHGGALP
ncbi:hypothetical protein NKH41_31040 [Mesorhizobium sp. M1169]|uniref:hypothetical protein n=1 Tax=Mesorhizobium sp. M1169 TaxID=2957066 RepID=UPI003336E7F3